MSNSIPTKSNKLYILTYNVRTLSTYGKLIELTEALKNVNFDIIGLSETRRLGIKIEEYENCILCHSGLTQGQYGVGFLIKSDHKKCIESFIGISDRIALLNLNIQNKQLSIIQVYAPTEAARDEEIDSFYADLYRAMEIAHHSYIIMGDLNAKIGQPRSEEYLIMKPNGYGVRNQRGQKLIDFAVENKIAILNTYFKRKPNRKWTWRSPNGEYKNEIDYILTNKPGMVQNMEVLNLNFSSDHRPVRATITLAKTKKKRIGYNNKQNSILENKDEITRYNEYIAAQLPNLQSQKNITVQNLYDKILNAISQSLQDARIPNKSTNKRHKILSESTLALLEKRKLLIITKNKTRSMKNELSALYKLISKRINHDYKSYRCNTIERYLATTGSSKRAFKELQTNKTWIDSLKSKGKTLNTRNEVIGIATEFYKKLYSAQENEKHDTTNQNNKHHVDTNTNCPPFTVTEVDQAISRLKMNKSPGADNITNEAIRSARPLLALPLTELFNKIIESSRIPTQWSETDIILIYKKGDPCDVSNYRPICLLPGIYKLFSSLINQRISNKLESEQPIEQAGFRKKISTIDHIHSLELVIEKYQEKQRRLYIAFIDYQKAFDTVSHRGIWKALEDQGLKDEYIQILKNIYTNIKGRVKLERVGPSFPIKRGVRQGDPTSPTLFIALLESIIKKLDWKTSGLNINGTYLSHLRFADDLVVFAESSSELQNMIQALNSVSKEVGLEMNLAKTMLMTNSIESTISIDNEIIYYTNKYIYLGKQISFNKESNNLEIERRTQLTWNKYWGLKEIFKSNMPIKIKANCMSRCLLPCLTYACQTWKHTAKIKKKITTCQRGLERSMLNIKKIQKIRHTKIRKITQTTDVLNLIRKFKWKWAGHVARLTDDRWTQRITKWRGPTGKRCRGRPLTRWDDDIRKIASPDWMKTAEDREKWSSLEEAYTRGGVLAEQ